MEVVIMPVYGNDILNYRYQIVNEAYFGKTDTLLEIEKQIGIIRKNALKKLSDINRSPEVQKLNRLFEKQFGMEVFALHIERNDMINAYTVPIAIRFDVAFDDNLKKKITATKEKGYFFKPGNNLCIICNVYLGLLKQEQITDEEMTAIILHELGHNFADALNHDIEVANYNQARGYFRFLIIYGILQAFTTFGLSIPSYIEKYRSNLNKVNVKREKRTRKRIFTGLISTVRCAAQDLNQVVNSVLVRLGGGKDIAAQKKILDKAGYPNKIRKSTGRINEVIADKFAGIYGYGPAQVSALMKMEKVAGKAEKVVDKIPIIGKIANQNYFENTLDINNYDVHPQIIQRLTAEVNLLKAELEKADIDPKLVEAMKKEVEQLEKLRDNLTKVVDQMSKNEKMQAEYNKYINDSQPNPLDDKIEEEIHKAFDDMIDDD